MSHILDGESRVLVFSVDPDDPMAQPSHGQDGSRWKRSTGDPRPGERSHNKETDTNAFKMGSLQFFLSKNDIPAYGNRHGLR